MIFSLIFDIDKDIIKIYYYKNIELFYQNLIDIALEYSRCVGQYKRHYLVLKMAVAGLESHFPFMSFSNLYPIVSISQVKLDETPSPTQSIQ